LASPSSKQCCNKKMKITQPTKCKKKKKKTEKLSPLTTYLLGGVSACTAESVVYPLDTIKTRLQVLEKKHVTSQNRGMFRTGWNIMKQEGITGFYNGFTAGCYRHMIYSGGRILSYDFFREKVLKRDENGHFPLWKSMLSAVSAGFIGQFFASPLDLVKVRMQTEGLRILRGEPALYDGSIHCLVLLYREFGFVGMWRGWFPNCQRAALVQLGDLTAYDMSKQYILKHTTIPDNFMCHGLASIAAGFVATVMSTPSDVVKTRMMADPKRYRGAYHCLRETVNKDGILALYKGFFPIWARMGPKAMVFYLTFEQLRNVLGLRSW